MAAGGEPAPVAADRDRKHWSLAAGQDDRSGAVMKGRQVPDEGRVVGTTDSSRPADGHQPPAVLADHEATVALAGDHDRVSPGLGHRQAPQTRRAVTAAGDDPAVVRAEAGPPQLPLVTAQHTRGGLGRVRSEVPNARAGVQSPCHQPALVVAKGKPSELQRHAAIEERQGSVGGIGLLGVQSPESGGPGSESLEPGDPPSMVINRVLSGLNAANTVVPSNSRIG